MKDYLNKGLLYAWFNSAKAPITIGLVVWGIVAHVLIEGKINGLKNQISSSFNNYCFTENLDSYFILGIIFIAIYFIAQGINKRNTAMFLSSGPYTKKQIKFNELISISITLMFFIVAYIYIVIMAYISNKEFLQIVDGYFYMTLIEIMRIVLIGMIAILFMIIVDSMFSNTIIGFISMISLMPMSIIIIISKLFEILRYLGINFDYKITHIIGNIVYHNFSDDQYESILLNSISLKNVGNKQLFMELLIALIILLGMIIIFNVSQRIYKIEYSNKIFSSKANENIIVILVSVAAGSVASLFFLTGYINSMQLKYGEYQPLMGSDIIKGLGLDIIFIGTVGLIAYKVLKKIIKNLV